MQGAIAVAQGTAMQQQINFTRSNEYEADRVGIEALAEAGFDPDGMASFFEVISRDTRPHEARLPEFLRTHPVSSSRIAEARGRARDYPSVETENSRGYGIAQARRQGQQFHDIRTGGLLVRTPGLRRSVRHRQVRTRPRLPA
ncbi:MAG: M48 family metalloprotease [Woeseiaceae bacterium]|nr:M48 family metalloprotease [Woeseiaceae bacterium]